MSSRFSFQHKLAQFAYFERRELFARAWTVARTDVIQKLLSDSGAFPIHFH